MNLQFIRDEILRYVHGMWRYRVWALIVAWMVFIAGWLFVYSMPDQYGASAKVYVDTDSLMNPVFDDLSLPDNLNAQVDAVSRQLLTRPNLETVARKTDLHLLASDDDEMEALITRLQENIRIRSDRRSNVFDIEFKYSQRSKAFAVVSALVDGFVEDSLQGQGDDSQLTLEAVQAEIVRHENRLTEAEDRLAEFKKGNVGYMPNDRGDYYSRLQSALTAVDETEAKIRSLSQRRNELRRQLDAESSVLDEMAATGTLATGCSQQAQIAELETQLAALRVDFTDKHPRIVSLRENIDALKKRCADEAGAARQAGVRPGTGSEGSAEPNSLYENLRMMLADTEVELATLGAQLAVQQEEVDELRQNVDRIADVEKNLKQLNRDYDVVQDRYQLLLSRRENLRSKLRLDPVKDVSFRILEPPFASSEPVGPPRPLFLAAILVVAVGAGGLIALGLSELNPAFFSRKEVARVTGLPVLGSVSLLLDAHARRARWFGTVVWLAGCAALVLFTGFTILFHAEGADLLQGLMTDAES